MKERNKDQVFVAPFGIRGVPSTPGSNPSSTHLSPPNTLCCPSLQGESYSQADPASWTMFVLKSRMYCIEMTRHSYHAEPT
jgi:hypothetical protein